MIPRVPAELVRVLQANGIHEDFIAAEISAMSECVVAKTANRIVLGIMKEFVFEAEVYRGYLGDNDLLSVVMRLSRTPGSPIGYNSPDRFLGQIVGSGLVA